MNRFNLSIAAMLVFYAASAGAQGIQVNKENKTIAITTSDSADALADTAVLTIGFNSYGKDQSGTYAEATRISNAIVSALDTAGVNKEAVQSTSQSLSPINPGNDDDKTRYAQGLRFEFNQHWNVTVPATKAGEILHVAITAGANNSGGIEWKLQQDDALEAEAAKKALEHARQIAERMAHGLGVKLGALLYASNEQPNRVFFPGVRYGATLNTSSASLSSTISKTNLKPLAISPERISKSATVYAVFSIE